MFTANDYKVAKRVYDDLVVNLPHKLRKYALKGYHVIPIKEVNDHVDAVIAAFHYLEGVNGDINVNYDIDPKRGIIYLHEEIASRAEKIDEFLKSNVYHLLGIEFGIVTEWDKEILDIRGFSLEPDKDGKLSIQLKKTEEYI